MAAKKKVEPVEDGAQTLDAFVEEMKRDLEAFHQNWKKEHEAEPEKWPMRLAPGDWYDQLLMFMSHGGGK